MLHGIITNDLTAWIPCRETQRGPSTWRSTVVSRFGKRDINHMSYGTWRQVYNRYWSLRDECISLVKGDHGVSLILPFLRNPLVHRFRPSGLRTVTYSHSFICMRATSCVQLNFFRCNAHDNFSVFNLRQFMVLIKVDIIDLIFIKLNLKRFIFKFLIEFRIVICKIYI